MDRTSDKGSSDKSSGGGSSGGGSNNDDNNDGNSMMVRIMVMIKAQLSYHLALIKVTMI